MGGFHSAAKIVVHACSNPMLNRSMADETGAGLLRRIAGLDRAAMAEFYDLRSGLLFSIAMRILEDAGEAEEVIQDVFLQIWQKAATFDPELGSAVSWAVSITRNRAIDRLRSRQRRFRLSETLQEEASRATPLETKNFCGSDNDSASFIRKAVNSLPQEQRQAIEMAFFGGLTHQEIAESLREPLGTVKARIRRGMMKLRDSLQPYL
jgi:RNA polymerase sigma-70 factor (ECF subfamily)